jgi:hypothetical protein
MTKVTNPFRSTKAKVITSNKLNTFNRNIIKYNQLQNAISGAAVEKLDSTITINCNDSNNLTTPNAKYINTFDNAGNLIENSQFNWSAGSSAYIFAYKNDYTYDNQGRLLTNTEDDSFYGSYFGTKYEYVYNINGNDSISFGYNLDQGTNTWIIEGKTKYTYNGSNILTEMGYGWDSSANNWDLDSKTFHYFDSYKNDTLVEDYTYDNNNWIINHKQINQYTYNEAEIKTAKICFEISYNIGSTTIGMAQKNELTYDSYGNMLTNLSSRYNTDSGYYDLLDKSEYLYDINTSPKEVLMGNLLGYECYNKLIDTKYYDYTGSGFVLAGKVNFYYTNLTIETGNTQIANHSFSVYPNPATEYIKFNVPGSEGKLSVAIINLQGKTVLEKQVENNAQVDVKGLINGLYLYKVTENSRTYNGKVIIK